MYALSVSPASYKEKNMLTFYQPASLMFCEPRPARGGQGDGQKEGWREGDMA